MKKQLLVVLIAFICALTFVYCAIAFILMQANPFYWEQGARFTLVIFTIGSTLGMSVLGSVLGNDNNLG